GADPIESHRLFGLEARDLAPPLIDVLAVSLGIGIENTHGRRLDQRIEKRLRLFQRRLGMTAGGDVAGNPEQPGGLAVIESGFEVGFENQHFTAAVKNAGYDISDFLAALEQGPVAVLDPR